MKKTIIVSAISLRSGGTLSILCDCLKELNGEKYIDYAVYAIIKDRNLLDDEYKNISLIERNGVGFYLKRLYYEFIYFHSLSKKLKPTLWLSLHDITPNVKADIRAVYCHNPTPFYRASLSDFLMEPVFGWSTILYKYLYRINVRKNNYVVVQQQWIRNWFVEAFKLDNRNVIVARPNTKGHASNNIMVDNEIRTFIFPALPRVFKNFELIGEAVDILIKRGINNFEIFLTIDGKENRYSKWLMSKYGHLVQLNFIGRRSRQEIFDLYEKVDCLIFPSKLETWGLPLSEFKSTGKLILASKLPYAAETIGDYNNVVYFSALSPENLADKMETVMRNKSEVNTVSKAVPISQPVTEDWNELFEVLLSSTKKNSSANAI